MKTLATFLAGILVGGVGAGALVIYWRRMQAYEELLRAQRQMMTNMPPPQVNVPAQAPTPGVFAGAAAKPSPEATKAKMHEIARERAGVKSSPTLN